MKSIGIVRNLDPLGRIVIPVELRRTLRIHANDPIEIYTVGESIVLKKYTPVCVFCGEAENTIAHNEKLICKECLKEIARKKK